MNFYTSSGSSGFYRTNPFALKPDGKVFFQNQNHFSGLVCRQIAFLDGTVDGVVATFGQFRCLVNCHGIVLDHFLHASSTAVLISEGLPQTQVTLLMPVTSSSRNATAGGQRRLPRIM